MPKLGGDQSHCDWERIRRKNEGLPGNVTVFDYFWALTYISSHTHPRVVNFTLFSREVYVLVLYYLLYRSVNLNWFCFSAQNKQWIYSTVATQKRTTTVYCAKVIEMFLKSLKSTLRSVWQYWQFWFLKDFNGFSFSTSNVFNAVWFVFRLCVVFMFMLFYLFVSLFLFFWPCIVLFMVSKDEGMSAPYWHLPNLAAFT